MTGNCFFTNWEKILLNLIGNGALFWPLRHRKKIPVAGPWKHRKTHQTTLNHFKTTPNLILNTSRLNKIHFLYLKGLPRKSSCKIQQRKAPRLRIKHWTSGTEVNHSTPAPVSVTQLLNFHMQTTYQISTYTVGKQTLCKPSFAHTTVTSQKILMVQIKPKFRKFVVPFAL